MHTTSFRLFVLILILKCSGISAQNPVIRDQYSADPTARFFGDSIYLYPSHDILATEGRGRIGWFCMEDYHVFSSADLTRWTDHGVIVDQTRVDWVNPNGFSMWAPDCIMRDGKYYFYFPAFIKDTSLGRGFGIGVAVANKPYGPFIPQPLPIKNVHGIDPNVFIDKDNQAYLYWAMGKIYAARLADNMLELASEPKVMDSLPSQGLVEGPFLFERNGIYYLTYPHVANKTECLEYAIGNSPMGPFKYAGVIMDESPTGCWTNHQSIVEYKGQWYLFYHHNDYSPRFDKNRSVRIDSLFFNADGTIQKVKPTLRGVGLTKASENIETDRYSLLSNSGASVELIDSTQPFKGFKLILSNKNSWAQYNKVDFGNDQFTSATIRLCAAKGGLLQIRLDKPDGILLAELKISENNSWENIKIPIQNKQPGIHNLVITSGGDSPVAIDWVTFNRN
jgi:hypothetical protein